MAYIESHEGLRDHPKTKRAARLLDISLPAMVGHLQFLWWWCLNYADDGNLSAYDPADIADAAGWDGDPDQLITALIDCGPGDDAGFLETNETGGLIVHDWMDYAGRLVEQREQNRQRMRDARAKKRQTPVQERAAHVQRTTGARAGANNLNNQAEQPEQSREPAREETTATPVEGFVPEMVEILWQAPFVPDDRSQVEAKVRRTFQLVPDFEPIDGPYLAERFANWRKYKTDPPDDWFQTWLSWVQDEARDAAVPRGSPALAAVAVEDSRPHPEREIWVPYDQRPNYRP